MGFELVAINVLLEPDEAMAGRAQAANAALRADYPGGFALGSGRVPHVTLVQRYVPRADLDEVYAAVGRVASATDVGEMELHAVSYYYTPGGNPAAAGIAVALTPGLRRLHEDVLRAVAPYAAGGGTAAAFVTTPAEPEIGGSTISYVERFVPDSSGANFSPHVTVGIARRDFLERLVAEPFAEFAFRPVSLAIHQLGDSGTARRLLKKYETGHRGQS